MLKKEVEEDSQRKDIPMLREWKTGIPLAAIYKFTAIPGKIPGPLSTDIKGENYLQVYIASQKKSKQK